MNEQTAYVYTFLTLVFKAGGLIALFALIAIIAARFTPDFPEDDGERM